MHMQRFMILGLLLLLLLGCVTACSQGLQDPPSDGGSSGAVSEPPSESAGSGESGSGSSGKASEEEIYVPEYSSEMIEAAQKMGLFCRADAELLDTLSQEELRQRCNNTFRITLPENAEIQDPKIDVNILEYIGDSTVPGVENLTISLRVLLPGMDAEAVEALFGDYKPAENIKLKTPEEVGAEYRSVYLCTFYYYETAAVIVPDYLQKGYVQAYVFEENGTQGIYFHCDGEAGAYLVH